MRKIVVTAAALAAAGPAYAQEITLKPLAEARLRYEQVDQDDLADDSGALTARVRTGVSATSGGWSALVEAQGTLSIAGDHYDGLHGAATRPLINDPQDIALYRAQLQYRSPALTLTAGRQRITLDDERFVGAADFRQNGQTFDAVRAEWTPLKGLKADVSYAWSVRTIWGVDGHDARQQAVSGDNVFANLGYATPLGTLTGFAYLVDQDEAAVQGFRLSSQTYGARLAGSRPLAKDVKLFWQASYATQADYHHNPNDYRADYYLIDATLGIGGWKLGGGYEVLGADKGVALTSFQAPLGSVFKFQGWADKLVTTPPDGVRDLYGNLGHSWKGLGPFTAVSLQAVYHHFGSDRLVRHYGDEIDLLASGKLGKTTLSVRYADYQAKRFAADTSKLWLQVDWAL
ncbi:alginate export family protein [Sphingomonas cannabina]|uniref:alginate export family protein n=1 Tax=Sphingomonas cannabina TaxID=2899123 RepID=UPI001F31B139|nr:alginate export family protein [Sphingomonas cannabina]UIJ46102.1 alginate export family protein [Sphingomonas cannabina]